MKLYDVPRNTYILVNNERIKFHHIDGMYSLCFTSNHEICHICAWEEVEIDPNQED